MKSWKTALKEKKILDQTKAQLEERRHGLWQATGQRQFTKQVIEAELLSMNQEILEINNKLSKFRDELKVAPLPTPEATPSV
jgi:hypothetical protein